ncbi:sugar phosphate isomerase/epimerase family protein [Paenibacillus sepulcri]|uniref:Sugar phosphate isomerase/epimerase n=1 Tax=Paenibacillus sepulcri TaxID=359917 RepID=A0ABS7C3U5_9BACL|nr:sugar phosphate isomerase/epimerase [Paenibacillus sepulcri]
MKIIPSVAMSIMNVDKIRSSSSFIQAFELSVDFSMDEVSDAYLEELNGLRKEAGIAYTVHAPFRDVNIASLNNTVFEAARMDMMRSMEVAARIGAGLVVVHPGITGFFPEDRWTEMKRRELSVFEEMGKFGGERGIQVMVENLPKMNVHFEDTWTLDGIIRVHDEWESDVKGVCFDVGHAYHANLDVAEAVRRLGSRIKHLHVHDNHGGIIDEHLPIGQGTIPWDDFFEALEEIGFEGFAVFEFGPAERQREAVQLLEDRMRQFRA